MSPLMFAAVVFLLAMSVLAVAGVWLMLSIASKNHATAEQIDVNTQIIVNRYNSQVAAINEAVKAERAREEKARKKSDKDNLFKFNPRKGDDNKS